MKWILDFIFPPLCANCGHSSDAGLFCPACWEHCSPPDPLTRCRHCFEEIEEEALCMRCIKDPDFFFARAHVFESCQTTRYLMQKRPDALAGYVLYQWIQLDWPMPDFVITFPHRNAQVPSDLAEWLQVPLVSPFTWWSRRLIEDVLPEEATLLIWDEGTPIEILKRYESEIAEASPKKCFLLSLHS